MKLYLISFSKECLGEIFTLNGDETLKAFFDITTFNESKLLYPLIIRIKGNCYIRVIYLTYPYLPMPDSNDAIKDD